MSVSSSESTVSSHDASEIITRPNRWLGAPSTWASVTANEQGLASSLDALRDQDLSIHLFNSHALKRRARSILSTDVEEGKVFVPPKSWTAWPLSPEDVPRLDGIAEKGPGEEYSYKRRKKYESSQELEDVLMAMTLRFAKERFDQRKLARDKSEADKLADNKAEEYDNRTNTRPMEVRHELLIDSGLKVLQEKDSRFNARFEYRSERMYKPIVSADDEKSRELLHPMTRHTLSKLDDILLALHHSRLACSQITKSKGCSDDEQQERQSPGHEKTRGNRSRGRPRKFAPIPHRSRTGVNTDHGPEDPGELLRSKKTHRGRPQKRYELLKDETQHEYLVRIARIQKKPLPSFAPPLEILPSMSPSPSPNKPQRTPAELQTLTDARRKKLDLRDWSEVLGAAAIVGFGPEVVARATQRCASLLGESMSIRTIVEVPFEEQKDVTKLYRPKKNSSFTEEFEDKYEEASDTSGNSELVSKLERKVSTRPTFSGEPSHIQICFCPISGCARKAHGFRDTFSLRRHLKKAHKIDDEELEDYVEPSDEEMDGAVHVDGFLRPIKLQRASRKGEKSLKAKVKAKVRAKRTRPASEKSNDETSSQSMASPEAIGERRHSLSFSETE